MTNLNLKEISVRYSEWVSRNPQTTSGIESAIKWISFFLAGRRSKSVVVSELVYSISNLIVLFNDNIIRKCQPLRNNGLADKLKMWLTVLEYSEVLFEVSAAHTWGARGKWIVISLIQIFKCLVRLLLLYRYKENFIQNPPVVPLRRNEINKPTFQLPPEAFTLKSGRVIRTVESSSPALHRTWRPPEPPSNATEDVILSPVQFMGEVVYITKPVAHLITLYGYGPQNWRPWVLALAMDFVSLQLLKTKPTSGSNFSRRQHLELSRRQVSLLLYLLRSPLYESQTRDRLQRMLASCSSSIPLVGLVLRPLAEYIPHWQRTYFYMWST